MKLMITLCWGMVFLGFGMVAATAVILLVSGKWLEGSVLGASVLLAAGNEYGGSKTDSNIPAARE